MKSIMAVALVFVVGCADEAETTNEIGITYQTVTDDRVEGTFRTQYGTLDFKSVVVADGVVDVSFVRGDSRFGSHVNWETLTNELQFADGFEVTTDDKFLMLALTTALEADIGNQTPASDNLIRQSILWGHHPEGAIVQATIVADAARGWTKLCNVSAYTFNHDAWSHGQQYEYLAAGINERANPCRDRCGPGCTAWWGTSAWTKDCGDHDRCEQEHSSFNCGDEFSRASDDYSFAGNCPY